MQTELNLKIAAPEVTSEEVEQLIAYSRGRGWCTARQIEAEMGMDDRKVRAIAEHSDGRVLSGPGCPGYRYFDKDALPYAERAIAYSRRARRARPAFSATVLLEMP